MRPLSALQRRYWHLCTTYSGTSSPIVVLAWKLTGPLDVPAFERAVSRVVDRHESLRSRFQIVAGTPWLITDPPGRFVTELLTEGDPTELVSMQSQALLDLERGPLVRSTLRRLSDLEHVWCLTIHHILADGGSSTIIGNEICAGYRGEALPDAPEVTWQEDPEELDWWVENLAGTPVLDLPADLPRPPAKGTRGAPHDHVLPDDLIRALEQLARSERSTLFMVLLTALQIVLSEWSDKHDFCVGIPADGRGTVESEEAVGLFANMLALRLRSEGGTFRKRINAIRAVVIDALSRQTVPFGQIVQGLGLPQDLSRTQVFQTIFCLHTEATPSIDLPGVEVTPFGVGNPQTLHDLVLDLWRNDSGISAAFRYDSGLFEPGSIAGLAQRYEEVLRAAAADPEAPI